jgi:hypothetical protein
LLASSEIKNKSLELKLTHKNKTYRKLENGLKQMVETSIPIDKRRKSSGDEETIDTVNITLISNNDNDDENVLHSYLTKVQQINHELLNQIHEHQEETKGTFE